MCIVIIQMVFQYRPSRFMQRVLQLMRRQMEPMPLGRWNVDYCPRKMETKVDMANEDHCGPCGQYAMEKINQTHQTNQTNQTQPNPTLNPTPNTQPKPTLNANPRRG